MIRLQQNTKSPAPNPCQAVLKNLEVLSLLNSEISFQQGSSTLLAGGLYYMTYRVYGEENEDVCAQNGHNS